MAANQKRRTRRQPQDGAHLDPLIQPVREVKGLMAPPLKSTLRILPSSFTSSLPQPINLFRPTKRVGREGRKKKREQRQARSNRSIRFGPQLVFRNRHQGRRGCFHSIGHSTSYRINRQSRAKAIRSAFRTLSILHRWCEISAKTRAERIKKGVVVIVWRRNTA